MKPATDGVAVPLRWLTDTRGVFRAYVDVGQVWCGSQGWWPFSPEAVALVRPYVTGT